MYGTPKLAVFLDVRRPEGQVERLWQSAGGANYTVEEIFAVIRNRIEDTGLLEQLSAGAVLTGGAVLMEGMTEFAEEILGMPVRLGVPVGVRGITQLVAGPQYATGVGLVQYGASALSEARDRARREMLTAAAQAELEPTVEAAPTARKRPGGSRLLQWLRAAF